MKNTVKMLFALAFAIFAVGAVNAQTINSGTIDFSVTTPAAFDLRGADNAQLSSASVSFADAGPNSTAAMSKSFVVRLRSNAAYQLTAVRTGAAGADDNDSARFDASDISVFVTPNRSSGTLRAGGNDVVNSAVVKLSDVQKGTGTTQLMSGDRISNQGDNNSDNFMEATLKFDATHQYYTPETYTETVTVGISARP
jgi:hypothetical protein